MCLSSAPYAQAVFCLEGSCPQGKVPASRGLARGQTPGHLHPRKTRCLPVPADTAAGV